MQKVFFIFVFFWPIKKFFFLKEELEIIILSLQDKNMTPEFAR